MEKLKVMNSTMGLRPMKADPHARPANPASVMGVSRTRVGPNRWISPLAKRRKVKLAANFETGLSYCDFKR
jgi:hypothetical protein